MNNISQISIFDYTEIENLEDLEKLKLFLGNILQSSNIFLGSFLYEKEPKKEQNARVEQ